MEEFVTGTEGQRYRDFTTKPIQQSLEETWFLWLSDDAGLKGLMLEASDEQETVEAVKSMVDGYLSMVEDGFIRDLCQRCQDYTDWQRLTRRLCDIFGIEGKVSW